MPTVQINNQKHDVSIKGEQLAQDLGTVGISSGGTSVATTVANINFVGAGNTFAVNGTTVDVSIEGGGGTKAGEAISYPSGTKSPFILNSTHITESITMMQILILVLLTL